MPGDLDHYLAQAEQHPLMRSWGGLILSPQGRAMKARLAEKLGDAAVACLDLEIARSVARCGMQHTADLIDQAVASSGGYELKFHTLLKIALTYGQGVDQVQRRFTSPFGF